MKIGCHVSIAGGVFNAPPNAAELGGEVFQIFSRSPRGGAAPRLTKEIVRAFWSEMKRYSFSDFVIHTPYYINFGSENKKIFQSSSRVIREELERASLLSCKFVMTHLGSYKDLGREKGFTRLLIGLGAALKDYKGSAQLLLENSAGAGDLMGGTFEELSRLLNHPRLKNANLGICFDTCHAFASGYDLRTPKAVDETLKKFDKAIGLSRLKVAHLNDSKLGLNEHRDRHEHIGRGKIGKAGFAAFINYPKLKQANGYLETEHDLVKEDISLLKTLRK